MDFLFKFAVISLCVFGLVYGVFSPFPKEKPFSALEQPIKPVVIVDPTDSMLRLHDIETGVFFCTGFVVSERLAITAAHCIAPPPNQFSIEILPPGEVLQEEPKPTIMAIDKRGGRHPLYVHGFERTTDLGLVRGHFHTVPAIKLNTTPLGIDSSLSKDNNYVYSCGFPFGGPAICAPFKPNGKNLFSYMGDAVMYPGMSGGPVFDGMTQTVVGLNTGAIESQKIVSPLVNICNILNCAVDKQ